MTRTELGNKIRELALVALLAFCAMPFYVGYWAVYRGQELMGHPANARAEARAALVKPGRMVSADGVEILGRKRDDDRGPWLRTYSSPLTFCHLTGYDAKTGLQNALRDDLVESALHRGPLADLAGGGPVGNDVELTIVSDAQRVARRGLQRRAGAAVALDPRTGEILVLASGPTYDPLEVKATDQAFTLFNTDPDSPGLNRALRGLYPPGSIFKLIAGAAAIEGGTVSVDREHVCTGSIWVDGREMACWKRTGHGKLDMAGAVANSCNVYFANLGIDLGTKRMSEFASESGIFGAPDLVLWAKESQVSTDDVGERASANYAIGQGKVAVTPLAAARLAGAISREGRLVDPWLVKAVLDPEGRVLRHGEPGSARQAIRPSTARILAGMMELVVESGTADGAAIPGVKVAGKTGSAENPSGAAHAWFIGFAPADDPRVAVAVVVEHGGSGGAVAAPIARDIIAELLK